MCFQIFFSSLEFVEVWSEKYLLKSVGMPVRLNKNASSPQYDLQINNSGLKFSKTTNMFFLTQAIKVNVLMK